MWWELNNFADDLENLETLLFKIAAHDDELKSFGLRYVLVSRKIDLEKYQSAFDEFSTNLATCVRIAPFVDISISDRLNLLLSETRIEDLITQLSVRLKITERERPRQFVYGIAMYGYMFRRLFLKTEFASLFSDKTIPIESVLASLAHLKTIIRLLEKEHYRKTANDDEIFKPSNIDLSFVTIQIDGAIENLNLSTEIEASEKERLIIYLNEAKIELAEDSPAWKKIVGALIICTTLLSGVAAAPQAIDNLNDAIKHILGTSVEKNMPNLLPKPQKPKEEKERNKGISVN